MKQEWQKYDQSGLKARLDGLLAEVEQAEKVLVSDAERTIKALTGMLQKHLEKVQSVAPEDRSAE